MALGIVAKTSFQKQLNKIADSGKLYIRQEFTGGTDDALDSIDGSLLQTGVSAVVIKDNIWYPYKYVEGLNEEENPPYVIAPDTNPTGRWISLFPFDQSWFSMDLIANGQIQFEDSDDLTVEKKTAEIQMPDDCYANRIYYLAIGKPIDNTAGDLTVKTYNLVKINGVNVSEVLHTIHTVEMIENNPTYRGFLIQGLGFGEKKIKLGFKFASDSGAITVDWALYK